LADWHARPGRSVRHSAATGGRQDIPVDGNIGEIEGVLARTDDDLQNNWNMGPAALAEVNTLRAFIAGRTAEINLVVNTDAAEEQSDGHHWITGPGRTTR
jgi:hypothetical protein